MGRLPPLPFWSGSSGRDKTSRRGTRVELEQKGLSAYLAELIGTFLLVFFITSVVTLYVSTGAPASFGTGLRRRRLCPGAGPVRRDLHVRRDQRWPLQPGRDARRGDDPTDQRDRRGHLHPRPAVGRGARRAADQGACCSTRVAPSTTAPARSAACSPTMSAGAAVEAIGVFALVLVILAVVFSEKSPRTGARWRSASPSSSWSWSAVR